jgi:hypothetical protein
VTDPVPQQPEGAEEPGRIQESGRAEETAADFDGTRTFDVNGERWTARIAGTANTGTGEFARGVLVVVLFHREDEERASRFAYVAQGRLEYLFESELKALFLEASEVRDPDSEPGARPDSRPVDGTIR